MKRRYISPAMGFVAAKPQRMLAISIQIASQKDSVDAGDAAGRSDDEDNEW